LKGTKSNALSRTPISILFSAARIPAMISRRMRVRFSNDPPNFSGTGEGTEEFMKQIAVAMLEIDEVGARFQAIRAAAM